MSIAITLITVAFILAATVYVLHRYQQSEKAESADRANPLPPLERSLVDNVNADEVDDEEFHLTPPTQRPTARKKVHEIKSAQTSASTPPNPVAKSPSKDWQVTCKSLRDEHQFDEALELCKSNFPQLNAFKQACLIMRAKIRSDRAKGNVNLESNLMQLHRLAASAAFFHEKNAQLPALLSSAHLKHVVNIPWESIVTDYPLVGFEHLSLLTATDQKMLIAAFGEPQAHAHMRELNEQVWRGLQP